MAPPAGMVLIAPLVRPPPHYTLHPKPTHSSPYTLHPTPYTLSLSTLHPALYTPLPLTSPPSRCPPSCRSSLAHPRLYFERWDILYVLEFLSSPKLRDTNYYLADNRGAAPPAGMVPIAPLVIPHILHPAPHTPPPTPQIVLRCNLAEQRSIFIRLMTSDRKLLASLAR